ncbi:hypothetical protein OIU79_002667 [Salix purpurea]|uniref:Pentatricopeptide repeat-containing protein n=1 Tax=Salix purpurea TaxID=77065 RepID=A0A9Q0UJQ7_SALPP|nr:hypothetical protein OIU79_002667 [Salix purpurea]
MLKCSGQAFSSTPSPPAKLWPSALSKTPESLQYARLVFSQISNPTSYTCNSIIRGCADKNLHQESLLFYQEMMVQGLIPDRYTFPSLFKSCRNSSEGKTDTFSLYEVRFRFGCICPKHPDEYVFELRLLGVS